MRAHAQIMKATTPVWRYRLAIASRTLAATTGGYALASGFAATLTLCLAWFVPRVEAVLIATMLAWLAYTLGAIWAFYARTAWGAWCGTLLPALALGACAMAPGWMKAWP